MGFLDSQAQAALDGLDALVSAAEAKISDLTAQNANDLVTISGLQSQLAAANAKLASLPPQLKRIARFADVHLHNDWKKVTGSTVGGTAPETFTYTHVADPVPDANCVAGTVLKISIVGTAYKDGLFSDRLAYTFPSGKLRVKRHFRYRWVGDKLQAHEFDTKFVGPDGSIYDGSLQNAWYLGGILQMWKHSSSGGSWFNGPSVGVPAVNVKHELEIEYELDTVAKTIRYIGFTHDGTFYDLSATPAAAATPSTWGIGIVPQHQLDTPSAGAAADVFYDQDDYEVYLVQ